MEEITREFGKIYDRYNAKIYRFIFLKVSSPEIAEDLASEVFMKAWERFQEQAAIENIQAYLYQIARNAVADHHSRKKAQVVAIDESADIADLRDVSERQATVSMEMERVQKALATLNDDYQDFVIWRYLDELSVPEIAQIIGKSEESVRVGIHRALQALKAKIEA